MYDSLVPWLKGRLVRFDSIIPILTGPVSISILLDRCYPSRYSIPSHIKLPSASGNNYELKSEFINMLPKFTSSDSKDTYMFISEFQEVYVMMKIQQLCDDANKLRFIPFSLKGNSNKWLYNLPTNLISKWDEFVKIFLKKFYPIHKKSR